MLRCVHRCQRRRDAPRLQFNVTELAATGKQADIETELLRHKALAANRVVELAREKTPPPPPPLKQVSSEQLNSFTLRVAVGKRAQASRDFRSFEV